MALELPQGTNAKKVEVIEVGEVVDAEASRGEASNSDLKE